MPLPSNVRACARVVAKRRGLEPWSDHRDAVLPEVYRDLGLGAYTPKGNAKRKRPAAPAAPPECAVCMEPSELVVLVPCGHQKVCGACAERCRDRCPVCRVPFISIVTRVYA